jgi:hypothetical protein
VASAAIGQVSFHFGLAAGIPLTDTLVSSSDSSTSQFPAFSLFSRFNSETKRLLIGPTLRVETQSGIGFEVDALYQRVDSDFSALLLQPLAPAQQVFQQTTANRWQFPVLVQYSRKFRSMRWFAGAGPFACARAPHGAVSRREAVWMPAFPICTCGPNFAIATGSQEPAQSRRVLL